MNKLCAQCGLAFTGHFKAKLCSDECRLQWFRTYRKGYHPAYRARHRKPQPEREPIPPFPDGIDRDEFGNWLSGFCDGESTFGLKVTQRKTYSYHLAYFRITLRDDDTDCLRLIQSYWACGMVYFADNVRSKTKANPIAAYCIQATPDLARVVVPHFEQFPLRSKKMNDFIVWKQAIKLMSHIQSRPTIGRLGLSGIMPKWTDEDREKFRNLAESLVDQRKYTS